MSEYGYLAHHGIKGQKWGIRRYENPDGTLTEAGKRRYGANLYTKEKAKKLYGNAGRKAAARRYYDLQKIAKESVKEDIKNNKVNRFDKHSEIVKRTYNEYEKRYSKGKKQEVGAYVRDEDKKFMKEPTINFMRDQAAYKIERYKRIDTVQNALSAISSLTLGIGIFGSTNTKKLKESYRLLTKDTVEKISGQPVKPVTLSSDDPRDYIKEV